MSQNRDAPAYQEYASSMLSRLPFRTMSLQDRGLLYTMRLECWVNVRLPHNQNDLAKVLGLPVAEVVESLAAVMPFFEVVDGFIINPELEDYRAHLNERSHKQSQGGKRGSAITNSKRKQPANGADDSGSSTPSSYSRLPRRGGSESSAQQSPEKPSQNQLAGSKVIDDPFVAAYEAAESCTADAYARASGGS
jgi:hypothetical protein